MSTTSVTFQQANTTDGTFDPKVSKPKPVTVEAAEPRRAYIGHPTNSGPEVGALVGFTATPDPNPDALQYVDDLPTDPAVLVGMFPVYEDGGFWTDPRVIERIVSFETDTDDWRDALAQARAADDPTFDHSAYAAAAAANAQARPDADGTAS